MRTDILNHSNALKEVLPSLIHDDGSMVTGTNVCLLFHCSHLPHFPRLLFVVKNNKIRRLNTKTPSPTPPPTPIPCVGSLPFLVFNENRPKIDGMIDQDGDGLLDNEIGWKGTEYDGFLKIPMYNAGRNNDRSIPIGNSYTGYDCSTNRLCVAAYLNDTTYFEANNCRIVVSSASSWISINGASNKYFVPDNTTPNSHYVSFPGDPARLIGKQCGAI